MAEALKGVGSRVVPLLFGLFVIVATHIWDLLHLQQRCTGKSPLSSSAFYRKNLRWVLWLLVLRRKGTTDKERKQRNCGIKMEKEY